MLNDSDSVADPTDRSRYDLMRAKHVTFPLSIPRKIRWCGYLALLSALVGPIVATLPLPVREAYFVGNPTTAPLGAATIVLLGVASVAVAVVGLTALALSVSPGSDPPEDRVWLLIGAEDAFAGIGFITGALGIVAGGLILASGYWGVDVVDGLVDSGIDPYLTLDTVSATPRLVTGSGLLVAAVALASSVLVKQRRP
mgnify:CR=1 FL=1